MPAPSGQGRGPSAQKPVQMNAKRRLPVLTSLTEQRPTLLSEGGAGIGLHRRDWQAYQALYRGVGKLGEPKVILIAGANERVRVGLATGLGAAAAIAGRRSLVVECDLARPALAEVVGLDPVPGLREYLCWAASAPELLQPVSLAGLATEDRPALGQLVFITAGRPVPDGSGLLAGGGFLNVLGKVSRAYDLVILSSGPLPSPELSAVAGEAQAMLVCVSPDQTSGPGAEKISAALADLPERPAGVVIHQRS